jgi:molybdate transport system substrate-binding protein
MTLGCRRVTTALVAAGVLFGAAWADVPEIRVLMSGAFTAAFTELSPVFERSTASKIVTTYGGSMGSSPDTIPNRLRRGEPADVVIMAAPALDELIKQGTVVANSRVDLARSTIGLAVRAGAPRPDISSVDALKRALLRAKSIAYSSSASGVYLSTELFPRLGIADQMAAKSRKIESEPVGVVVARGEAEIGFQQISELRPVVGIDIVGPLPPEAQRVTVFSAGIVAAAKQPDTARRLISFLSSPAAVPAIRRSGMDPIAPSTASVDSPSAQTGDLTRLAGKLEDVEPRVCAVDDVDEPALVRFDIVRLDRGLAPLPVIDRDAPLVGRPRDRRNEVTDLPGMIRVAHVHGPHAGIEEGDEGQLLIEHRCHALVR